MRGTEAASIMPMRSSKPEGSPTTRGTTPPEAASRALHAAFQLGEGDVRAEHPFGREPVV